MTYLSVLPTRALSFSIRQKSKNKDIRTTRASRSGEIDRMASDNVSLDRQNLSARHEPFNSYWQAPDDIESGYSKFAATSKIVR